jgi:hypothetical protein
MMSNRVEISNVVSVLGNEKFILVLGLGFDLRSTEILSHVNESQRLVGVLALTNVGWNESNIGALNRLHNLAHSKAQILGKNSQSILDLADELWKAISGLGNDLKIVVDISSMSHELLAILVAILQFHNRLKKCLFLYTSAKQYSFNTSPSEIWLSRGVKEIRSVLGFPGEQLPSRPLHLVIPLGFEVDRAVEVIQAYEPKVLSLGKGRVDDSFSELHFSTNEMFFDRLENFLRDKTFEIDSVETFEFSCVDPLRTKADLISHLHSFDGLNTVVCPLNTKVSTVGIALLALSRPEIQICYAQPIEYNVSGYASSGGTVTYFDFDGSTSS